MEKKGLTLTKKELKVIEEEKKKNFEERLKFIDYYTNWLKKNPNKVWSKKQNKLLNK